MQLTGVMITACSAATNIAAAAPTCIVVVMIVIIRPHRSATYIRTYMLPIVIDELAWSVCRFVCRDSEPCKSG